MFQFEFKNGVTNLCTLDRELKISSDPEFGLKPIELFVSALVGCSSGIFSKVLEKKRITVESIRIQAMVERNKNEANKITKIDLHFLVEGDDILSEQIRKSLEVTFKNCGMIQSVRDCIEICETFEIVSSK